MFHFYRQNQSQILTRDLSPQNIRIANLTGNSFSVTWFTSSPVIGSLAYGNTPSLGQTRGDDRDPTPQPRRTHIVTLTGLTPQTTYYFRIRNDTIFSPQKPLSQTTSDYQPPNGNRPLTGTLSQATTPELTDILIFLQTDASSDLVTFVDQNRNYLLPLNILRRRDLTSDIDLAKHPLYAALLASDNRQNSYITLPLPYSNPIPTLTLGQNLQLDTSTSANLLPVVQSNLSPNPSPF